MKNTFIGKNMVKMRTINEEEEITPTKMDSNNNNEKQMDRKVSRQLSVNNIQQQIGGQNNNSNNKKIIIDDDIYSFIEEIHKQNSKQKNKNFNSSKIDQRKDQKSEAQDNKTKKLNIGLSDNNLVDAENKSKAQKGLILLLNVMSKGEFVPEIQDYFKKKREELEIQKKKEVEVEKANEEERSKILESRKLSMNKQKSNQLAFKNDTINDIFKDDNDLRLDSPSKKFNDNAKLDKNIKSKENALTLGKKKEFHEDSKLEGLFEDGLMQYFSKAEVEDIIKLRNDEKDVNINLKLDKKYNKKTKNL